MKVWADVLKVSAVLEELPPVIRTSPVERRVRVWPTRLNAIGVGRVEVLPLMTLMVRERVTVLGVLAELLTERL